MSPRHYPSHLRQGKFSAAVEQHGLGRAMLDSRYGQKSRFTRFRQSARPGGIFPDPKTHQAFVPSVYGLSPVWFDLRRRRK